MITKTTMPDFYSLVPKTLKENLKYRMEISERCDKDLGFRAATMQACREDILYWINSFCWLFEPRARMVGGKLQPTIIPFITWCLGVVAYLAISKGWADSAQWIAAVVASATATGVHSGIKNTLQSGAPVNSIKP